MGTHFRAADMLIPVADTLIPAEAVGPILAVEPIPDEPIPAEEVTTVDVASMAAVGATTVDVATTAVAATIVVVLASASGIMAHLIMGTGMAATTRRIIAAATTTNGAIGIRQLLAATRIHTVGTAINLS